MVMLDRTLRVSIDAERQYLRDPAERGNDPSQGWVLAERFR